jgi:hypothetical protein
MFLWQSVPISRTTQCQNPDLLQNIQFQITITYFYSERPQDSNSHIFSSRCQGVQKCCTCTTENNAWNENYLHKNNFITGYTVNVRCYVASMDFIMLIYTIYTKWDVTWAELGGRRSIRLSASSTAAFIFRIKKVSIVTGYGLDDWGVRVCVLVG